MGETRTGKTRRFFGEVRMEMQKVTWPSKDELISSTGIVILFSILLAIYVGVIDSVFQYAIRTLIRLVS